MKAWIVEKHGAISDTKSLILKEKEEPVLQQGKALVEVHYCSLNHLDLWVRKGVPGHSFPLPLIPGCDVSGRITAVDSKEWSVGDAVVIQPVIFCGKCRNCKKKWISACENFGLFGETVDGGLTQKILVDLKQLVKIPDSVSLEQAACLPVAYMTAYQMLHRRAQIQKGDLILVQAGGSGVSVACIQIAKSIGAKVIATVGSPEKAKLLESLGVDEVILYRNSDFKAEMKSLLKKMNKKGVDIAIDHVGVDTFGQSLRFLNHGGRVVVCGATTGSEVSIDLKPLFFKNLSVLGSTMGTQEDLLKVLDDVSQKKYEPLIAQTFSFERVQEAMDLLDQHKIVGKVLVEVKSCSS